MTDPAEILTLDHPPARTTNRLWPLAVALLLAVNLGITGYWAWHTTATPTPTAPIVQPQLARAPANSDGITIATAPEPRAAEADLPPALMAAPATPTTEAAPPQPVDITVRNGATPPTTSAEKATALMQEGRVQEAALLWKKLLDQKPKHTPYLDNLATTLAASAAPESLNELRQLAGKYPASPVVASALSQQALRFGDPREAVQAAERAIERAPRDLRYQLNLAALFDQLGDSRSALMVYNSLLAAATPDSAIDLVAVRQRADYLRQQAIQAEKMAANRPSPPADHRDQNPTSANRF